MRVTLDHRSPVPLYHQLTEALRYRIATGELKSGTVLPPLRRAATLWGVNLHTVRRAYAELSRIGVVLTRAPAGTRVLSNGVVTKSRRAPTPREQFVRSLVSEARLRHGLDVDDLIGLIRGMKTPAPSGRAVSVVECSQTQCEDLAGQIANRWRVRATPWVLDTNDPPPDGPIVATYFHYNDVRLRWPERLGDVHFLAIAPEADLGARLKRDRRSTIRPLTVTLCEKDEAMARNITVDLVRILPAKEFRIVTKVVPQPQDGLSTASAHATILFSPRMWGELSERARQDPRASQVRYVFDPADLDALGVDQGWESQ